MKPRNKIAQGLKRFRFSLSTRIILSMAGIVFLTAVASVVIFSVIITNQTSDLETRLQKAFSQIQDYRKSTQVQVPAQTTVDQLKSILNDPNLSPEAQLGQVRASLRNSETVNNAVINGILRDAGLPVSSNPRYRPEDNPPPPAGTVQSGSNAGAPSGDGRGKPLNPANIVEQESDWRLFSPVVQASLLGSLIAALCAVLIGWFLSRTVIKPLRVLEQASERIADGNYSLEIKPEGQDDLGRLARSFNRMAKALRQTEQKRKELVADVAHELRTPLSSIQGYTEVLRDGLVTEKERQNAMYDHILKEVRHLSGMVNSLRVWMNNEHALEYLNIEDLPAELPAQQVVDRFRPAATEKNIKLELAVAQGRAAPQVRADSEALNYILSNLVDNALRYTPEGGSISINISEPVRLPGENRKVIWYEVKDSGSGIPAEHLPFVFERFYRVDKSRNRTTGGSGLGLAIVRDTVQGLGGEALIESVEGSGTTVRFWLPQAHPAGRKSGRKSGQALAGAQG